MDRLPDGKPAFKVVLRIRSGSRCWPEQVLAEGLTHRQAQQRAKQARRSYLSPHVVEVR